MELGTQRVWDYVGDEYIHRLICNKADGKLVELPSARDQPQSSSGQTFTKDKVEAVAKEYGMLLTTQLESQRLYFQDQIAQVFFLLIDHCPVTDGYLDLLTDPIVFLERNRGFKESRGG